MTERILTPAYACALKLQEKLPDRKIRRKLKKATISSKQMLIEELDEEEDFVSSEFSMIHIETINGLSTRSKKLVLKILQELKPNNTLWEFDPRKNSRDSAAISELRAKDILFKTGTPDIHFVNPLFLRRGREDYVLGCMIELLKNKRIVTVKDIKALKPHKKVKPSFYDQTIA